MGEATLCVASADRVTAVGRRATSIGGLSSWSLPWVGSIRHVLTFVMRWLKVSLSYLTSTVPFSCPLLKRTSFRKRITRRASQVVLQSDFWIGKSIIGKYRGLLADEVDEEPRYHAFPCE